MVHPLLEELGVVSETLLLPLYFRALESRRPAPILFDSMAEGLVAEIPYDFSKLDHQPIMQVATMMRVREIDRMMAHYLALHPDAVVVNIGAGLDTRFFRLDNGYIDWFELDLPSVTRIRQQFFEETDRYRFLDASMLDGRWPERIRAGKRPVLVVAEGVLLYFERKKVQRFMRIVARAFPEATLIFDAVSPLQVWMSHLNPALCTTQARFRWGLADPAEIEAWGDGFHLVEKHYYFDEPEPRLGWFNFFHLCPAVRFGFLVLAYMLGGRG